MSRVFRYNQEEEKRLLETMEGKYIHLMMIEMDDKSNLPAKAWGDVAVAVTSVNREAFGVCKEYQDDVVNQVRSGRGLFLHGGVGTGKTTWAYKIARKYIATLAYNKKSSNFAVYFANVPELMNDLKTGFNDPQLTRELNYAIQNADLVIFDDIGAENATEWAKEQLYHYINYRYSNNLATIFTSNLAPNSLEARVSDRIKGMTTIVEISGQSRR